MNPPTPKVPCRRAAADLNETCRQARVALNAASVRNAIEEVASASEQTSAAAQQVSASTQEMAAQVEQVGQWAATLNETARLLNETLRHFRTEQASATAPSGRAA